MTVAVSDACFMVEPASAVIVSANSNLQTASGGAHDVTLIARYQQARRYQQACAALLKRDRDGLPQESAWLTADKGEQFTLTAGKRKVIQAITLC